MNDSSHKLKDKLGAHLARLAGACEAKAARDEARFAEWGSECSHLEALAHEIRELSPLLIVELFAGEKEAKLNVSVQELTLGQEPKIVFADSLALRRGPVRSARSKEAGRAFSSFSSLRAHVEEDLLKRVAKAIHALSIDSIETYNEGHRAGRSWAIACEPGERRRFWRNRRDLQEADAEAVFDAIDGNDDDDEDPADWEARCTDFWGIDLSDDPPPLDFVRGFVAGALSIIAKLRENSTSSAA